MGDALARVAVQWAVVVGVLPVGRLELCDCAGMAAALGSRPATTGGPTHLSAPRERLETAQSWRQTSQADDAKTLLAAGKELNFGGLVDWPHSRGW